MSDDQKFDPSQPYEPVAEDQPQQQEAEGEKPAFDASKPHEVISQTAPEGEAAILSSSPQDLPTDSPDFEPDIGFSQNQIKAAIKGLGRGLTLGQSDKWAQEEPKVPGLGSVLPPEKAEDIQKLKEEHPVASTVGELAGSASLLGTGEGALGLAPKIAQLPKWSKLGANAIRGATEMGIMRGGDEVSKAMLGQGDPEAPVASALTNVGKSALIGAGTAGTLGLGGIGLKGIASSKLGTAATDLLEGISQRIAKRGKQAPNLANTITEELNDFHNSTMEGADDVFGTGNLKESAIQKLVPPPSPLAGAAIDNQMQKISDKLESTLQEAATSVKTKTAVPYINEDLQKWQAAVTNPNASYFDKFKATNELKQTLAGYARWGSTEEGSARAQLGRNLSLYIIPALEDTKVWGQAGSVQQGINKAFNELNVKNGPMKSFMKIMFNPSTPDTPISPAKVDTYLRQLGTPRAEIKQQVVSKYIDAMENYRKQISDLHNINGLESPLQPTALNFTKESLGTPTLASKIGDLLFDKGPSKLATYMAEAGGAALGGLPGYFIAKEAAPYLEKALGRPISNMGSAAVFKAFGANAPGAAGEALEYANNVQQGQKSIKNTLDNLFKAGAQKVYDKKASDKDKQDLQAFVEKGGMNAQMQNTLNKMNSEPPPTPKPPGYAQGGQVQPQQQQQQDSTPVGQNTGLASVYPTHNMMLQSARGRVYNHLNSIRPQPSTKLPFDNPHPMHGRDREYDRATEMALHPLSIMNKVKDGSIDAQDMKHFISMYPEIHSHLSKEMTKKIMEQQLKGEIPPYKTRQGMSLFLGSPLDTTFTPAGIQAAQAVFQPKPVTAAQGGAQGKTRKGTSTLGKSVKSYQTAEQSAESDRTERD